MIDVKTRQVLFISSILSITEKPAKGKRPGCFQKRGGG
jgi:hypothetical protein